jgi:hypothetical protein
VTKRADISINKTMTCVSISRSLIVQKSRFWVVGPPRERLNRAIADVRCCEDDLTTAGLAAQGAFGAINDLVMVPAMARHAGDIIGSRDRPGRTDGNDVSIIG